MFSVLLNDENILIFNWVVLFFLPFPVDINLSTVSDNFPRKRHEKTKLP